LNSRLPAWYTKCCQAKYLAIWPTIFISPQKVLLAPLSPIRGESALSLVFTVVLVTDVLLQLDHVSGTTYLPVCETRKSAAQNSENNWKHSCFRRTAAHRDFFLIIAPYKYSYLLTQVDRQSSHLNLLQFCSIQHSDCVYANMPTLNSSVL